MEGICQPAAFEYQKQQQFVSRWFAAGNSKLLLFHGIGSGKTCTSILTHLAIKDNIEHTYVATPASLRENFKKELLSECGKYKSIPSHLTVLSHQGFVKLNKSLKNCLIIVDEVQNVVSDTGKMYKAFFEKLVMNDNNLKVILLSATPMFDRPHEIALTMNLLNLPNMFDIKNFYKTYLTPKARSFKNEQDFIDRTYGYISAFKGISPRAFAKRVDRVVMCKMDAHQARGYAIATKGIEMPNGESISFSTAFLSGPRMAANIVYPSGGFGVKHKNNITLQDYHISSLKMYSTKFAKAFETIEKSNGPAFVYSNFVIAGGIEDFKHVLLANGYNEFPIIGPRTFGVFQSGKDKENSKLLNAYNNIGNKEGSMVKIILGSPAMKEGVSLKNTRTVHLLDPYWNPSRTAQIVGRALRFCSHISLPSKDRIVDVYHYAIRTGGKKKTVDEHIMNISVNKERVISHFEKLMYKSAIDCPYFHNANGLRVNECVKSEGFKEVPKTGVSTIKFEKIGNVLQSVDEKLEKTLISLLSAQGITMGSNKGSTGMEIIIPSFRKDVEFMFKNPQLNVHIYKTSYTLPMSKEKIVFMKLYTRPKKSPSKNTQLKTNKLNFNKKKGVKLGIKRNGGGTREPVDPKHRGCPKLRRPDETGTCPVNYPFLHKKGDKECCYARPDPKDPQFKGFYKHYGTLYLNGNPPSKYTASQLKSAYISRFGIAPPKLSKYNLIYHILLKI